MDSPGRAGISGRLVGALRAVRDWYAARQLWWGLGGDGRKIVIVPAHVQHTEDPAIGAGEGRSIAYIPLVLRHALGNVIIEVLNPGELTGRFSVTEDDIEALSDSIGGNDLILLGGSVTNSLSALAVKRLSQTRGDEWIAHSMPSNSDSNWVRYRDAPEPRYSSYLDDSVPSPETMTEDWGLFVIRPNCFSRSQTPKSRLVICYGAHTHGTEAAVNSLFSFESAAHISRRSKNNNSYWNYFIDGEVHIRSASDNPETTLLDPKRSITFANPPEFRDLQLHNPRLTPLPLSFARVSAGQAIESTLFYGVLFLSLLLLATGLFTHSIGAITLGALLNLALAFATACIVATVERRFGIDEEVFPRFSRKLTAISALTTCLLGVALFWTPYIFSLNVPGVVQTWLPKLPTFAGAIVLAVTFSWFGSILDGQLIRSILRWHRKTEHNPASLHLAENSFDGTNSTPALAGKAAWRAIFQGILSSFELVPSSLPQLATTSTLRTETLLGTVEQKLAADRSRVYGDMQTVLDQLVCQHGITKRVIHTK